MYPARSLGDCAKVKFSVIGALLFSTISSCVCCVVPETSTAKPYLLSYGTFARSIVSLVVNPLITAAGMAVPPINKEPPEPAKVTFPPREPPLETTNVPPEIVVSMAVPREKTISAALALIVALKSVPPESTISSAPLSILVLLTSPPAPNPSAPTRSKPPLYTSTPEASTWNQS
jgi:hypothetical protein